ncbi:hypothetical protein BDQ12DRAFT_730142 [Crucibulum laeve]|uniref:F-box domain-containing protein n=1 Tax=Crucibulum laeve TaxID=68775 RepID=A0A5C3MFK2_9AGAR|nr:hypothetical protein BDQ12DRAFT_730142 [Crucibulum laeve]
MFGTAFRKGSKTNGPMTLTSPVPHLLKTNQPPLEAEITLILEVIRNAKFELLRLEQKNQENVALDDIRMPYINFCSEHRVLLSPLRIFPEELLREIFIDVYNDEENPFWAPADAPWIVGNVCQRWRVIALSTPQLWGKLSLIPLGKETRTRQFIHFLDEILKRSRNTGLAFHLYASDIEKLPHPVLDRLVLQSHRWRAVAIEMSLSQLRNLSLEIRGKLPFLKTLSLDIKEYDMTKILDAFELAPCLREVEINSPSSLNDFLLDIPWRQLTHYKEFSFNVIGALRALRTASNLHSLSYTSRFVNSDTLNFSGITHATLHSLDLRCYNTRADNLDVLLDHLTLPSLEVLRLRSLSSSVLNIISLVSRSACHLKRLALFVSFREGEMADLFGLIPDVTELEINDISAADLLKRSVLLPQLQSLTIHTSHIPKSYPPFNDIIHSLFEYRGPSDSRCHPATPFSLRLICFDSDVCHDIQSALEGWSRPMGQLHDLNCSIRMESDNLKANARTIFGSKEKHLSKLLSDIEACQIDDAITIYSSRAHKTIHDICIRGSSKRKGNMKGTIAGQAQGILDKWMPLLVADIGKRKWISRGNNSLLFIKSSSIKYSEPLTPEDIQDIIFGSNTDLSDVEIFWPY